MRVEQLQPADASEIIDLLRRVFRVNEDARFVAPATIDWKYFTPRPDWAGSRSYGYRADGRIVAHCCVVPLSLLLDGRVVTVITVADWAATESMRGVGRALLADVTALVDARLAFGGSTMGAELLRRSKLSKPFSIWRRGFRRLRRTRLHRTTGSNAAVKALKWTRDSARLALTRFAQHGDWGATAVPRFGDTLPDAARSSVRSDFVLPMRTPALLNYLLDCPSADVCGYLLTCRGQVRGHLLLFGVNDEVRVGDLQIDSAQDDDWRDCFALAVHLAHRDFPDASIIIADAFAPVIEQALRRAGYRLGPTGQCRTQDPGARLSAARLPALGMMDNDTAWL
jgi:hypothetical protein